MKGIDKANLSRSVFSCLGSAVSNLSWARVCTALGGFGHIRFRSVASEQGLWMFLAFLLQSGILRNGHRREPDRNRLHKQ